MAEHPFTEDDLRQLGERGIDVDEAVRQLDTLNGPRRFTRLDRPATVGDGVRVLGDDEIDELTAVHESAVSEGRVMRFVPASGAATRMFKALIAWRERPRPIRREDVDDAVASGDADARAVAGFLDGVAGFAFADELREAVAARGGDLERLARSGPLEDVLDALLDDAGLGYADVPKGLVPFHAYPDGARTPFDEHLVEAATAFRGRDGRCRLHFTIAPEHRARFERRLERATARFSNALEASFDVGFSVQKPSTDTLAVDLDGKPFRLDDGRLLFRPAGHGALLDNLAEAGGDVLFLKNIDNVAPDRLKGETYRWTRALVGLLVRVQRQTFGLLERLERSGTERAVLDEAEAFAHTTLNWRRSLPRDAGERRAALVDRLDRPVRVCGMVPNVSEPGGGPFWVRGDDGAAGLQIVEMVQVDLDDPDQRGITERATHFNPVLIACGVRDRHGRPQDLRRYVDPGAAIVTRKSEGGRALKALERPGLWNGSMAGWNTIFVQVPRVVFNPVKTVNALLDDNHKAE